jgi:hypothetical protein
MTDIERWLSEVLLGRPVRAHVIVRVVRLFPAAEIGGLMALAAGMGPRDAGLRLLTGIALRDPPNPDQALIRDILGVSDTGTPEARADLYLTLAPWADDGALVQLRQLTSGLPDGLGAPTRASIEHLRALRGSHVAVTDPELVLDAIDRETRFAGDAIDLDLSRKLVGLPRAERDSVLRNGLARARGPDAPTSGGPTITCAVCGSVNDPNATFCGTCGAPLDLAQTAPPDGGSDEFHVVPGEGEVVPGKGEARRDLGRDDSGAAPEAPDAGPEPPPPDAFAIACAVCGTVNDASRTFCRKCGNTLRLAVPEPPPPPPPPARLGPGAVVGRIVDGLKGIGSSFKFGGRKDAPDPEPTSAAPPPPPAPTRVVNTGIAELARPTEPLASNAGLQVDEDYVFWLEIGMPVKGSIEKHAVGIAAELAQAEALLSVILFDADGSRIVVPGKDRALLRMNGDGSASVKQQAAPEFAAGPGADFGRRLFFPLRRQEQLGTAALRCNIYFEGLLIQSRIVRCDVLPTGSLRQDALSSTLDYVLTRRLTPETLRETAPHSLSIMVNEGQAGTNGFYFASGDAKWAKGATFDGGEIQDALSQARGALRMAAWGTFDEWDHQPYLYEGAPDRARLTRDLIRICSRGSSLYATLVARLAGVDVEGKVRRKELQALMRPPGVVQVALHAGPRFVLPAALLYDYPLDTGRSAEFTLCEQFVKDLDAGTPLQDAMCFEGKCPNATGSLTTVCPSGLWGFRHAIGLPVSLPGGDVDDPLAEEPGAGGQPPGAIKVKGKLEVSAGVSTDPDFKLFKAHQARMQALQPDADWTVADTRDKTVDLMLAGTGHVVYFYCHGGQVNRRPFILVGPKDGTAIFGDNLSNLDIEWVDPRPLVFINGCHTVAVEPELAHNLVSDFVTFARASGVIGTEITIFEPLAGAFAEAFMRAFVGGASVGDAIRLARLELLRQSNPLGLVYTAYALANLKLVH